MKPRRSCSWCLIGALLLGLLFTACAPEAPPRAVMNNILPENPLPPCPSSPNCVRETRLFDCPADTLFTHAQAVLTALKASALTAVPETRRLDAVFKVFLFKDDVALAVEPHEAGSVLHIRSASRIGSSDLGVNRRRVHRFFQVLAERAEPL